MSSEDRRKDFAAIAGLTLVIVVLFADVLFTGRTFYLRDVTRLHYPNKTIVRNIIASGELPSWNRFYSAGQPLAANPQFEVFYPGQWPIFLPDFNFGFRLHVLLHYGVAIIGMFLFLRSLPCGRLASSAGALAFALGGPFVSLTDLLPDFFGVAWIPWVLLFVRRFLLQCRASDAALASLALGMQLLILHPAVLAKTVILVIATIAIEWRRGAVVSARTLLGGAGIAIGALLAGAAQLVPAVDFMRDTVRAHGFSFEMVSFWSLPAARLFELLQPHILGHNPLNSNGYWGQVLYAHREGSPFITNLYCGSLVIVLALALLTVRGRIRVGMLVAGAAGIMLALGDTTPLLSFAYRIGIARSIRFPERFILVTAFVIAVAFAIAIERLATDRELARNATVIALALAGACFLIFALAGSAGYALEFARLFDLDPRLPNTTRFIAQSQIDWFVAFALFAIAALLIRQFVPRPRLAAIAATLFVLIDLGSRSYALAPRIDRSFFDAPPVASSVSRDRGRIFFQPEWHESSPTAQAYGSNRAALYAVIRNGMFPRTPTIWGFSTVFERDIDLTSLATSDALLLSMWEVAKSRRDWPEVFLPMAAAGYRAAYRPFSEQRLRDVRSIEPIVFVPVNPAQKYRFATSLAQIGDRAGFVRGILAERDTPRPDYVAFAPFAVSRGEVVRVSESSSRAMIDVDCAGRCYLVISESWHRYWTATIDGGPAQIEPTNLAYQGVVVPPGRHQVRLAYRNPLILPSAIASLVAALVLALVAALKSRSTS